MYSKYLNLVLALLFPAFVAGQVNFDRKLNQNRDQLSTLKKDILSIKSKLANMNKKEAGVLDQLALIDKETALISRSKGLLERENRLLLGKIQFTNRRLSDAEQHYKKLQELYAQRMVYAYKFGDVRNLELLLSSESLNQAFIRYRYLQKIAEHDERTIQLLRKKKEEIADLKNNLNSTLQFKQRNLAQKKKQESLYQSRKKEKAGLLKKVRWNQSTFNKQLAQKEKEKNNLIQMILKLERQRQKNLTRTDSKAPTVIEFDFDDFKKAKGKLPWPVSGKVVTHYGKQNDKGSKTYTKNTDIEISSKLGTPVRSVFKGVVRVITYLPGYGNTVIVDHGKGFYTVYSHLDEIYVQQDQGIDLGQSIATVGDSGSLAGTKLQFGIYGKQSTYDPEKWLR